MSFGNVLGSAISAIGGFNSSSSGTISQAQLQQTDQHQFEKGVAEMAAAEKMHEQELWKTAQQLMTKTYEMQQEVAINRTKTTMKIHQKWESTLTGS